MTWPQSRCELAASRMLLSTLFSQFAMLQGRSETVDIENTLLDCIHHVICWWCSWVHLVLKFILTMLNSILPVMCRKMAKQNCIKSFEGTRQPTCIYCAICWLWSCVCLVQENIRGSTQIFCGSAKRIWGWIFQKLSLWIALQQNLTDELILTSYA